MQALAAAFAVTLASAAPASQWVSPLDRDHPLVGRIWQPATATFVDQDAVEQALAGADFVLLGERHDNPDHHILQAALIRAMTAAGRRPAVVFEMIGEDRQPAIEHWRAGNPADGAGLGAAVDWHDTGWPDWPTYQPIADAAVAASLGLRAGNIAQDELDAIRRDGLAGLAVARRARLGLDAPLPDALAAAMLDTLFEAHCELMPRSALTPLLDVQRARDAILADNMVRAAALDGADSAVLITGSGHARADRGAPLHLAHLAPERTVATVAFVQVAEDKATPQAYGEIFGGLLPFDFVWFTPRIDDRDHCAELKQRLEKR